MHLIPDQLNRGFAERRIDGEFGKVQGKSGIASCRQHLCPLSELASTTSQQSQLVTQIACLRRLKMSRVAMELARSITRSISVACGFAATSFKPMDAGLKFFEF